MSLKLREFKLVSFVEEKKVENISYIEPLYVLMNLKSLVRLPHCPLVESMLQKSDWMKGKIPTDVKALSVP